MRVHIQDVVVMSTCKERIVNEDKIFEADDAGKEESVRIDDEKKDIQESPFETEAIKSEAESNVKDEAVSDDDLIEMTVEELAKSEEKASQVSENTSISKDNSKKKKNSRTLRTLKKNRKWIIIVIILIVVAIIFFQRQKKKAEELIASTVQEQEYDLIKRDDIHSAISTTGTVKSKKVSTLYSALKDTKITNVNYEVGDQVHEGDVVVTFSTENIEKKISQSEEDIATSKKKEALEAENRERTYINTYGNESYSLSSAQEKVESMLKALYEACDGYGDAKRALQDYKDGNLDDAGMARGEAYYQEQVSAMYQKEQQAQTNYQDAVTALAEANRKAANDLASAQTSYDSGNLTAGDSTKKLERELENYQDTLEDYIVTAPISGIVTKVEVEEGNGFNGGNLMVIQQNDSYIVTTEIDEYDIPSVQKGQKVVIKTDATRDDELEGVVSFVAPTATTSSSSSSGSLMGASSGSSVTYTVEIDLLTKDDRIKLGMSAKLNIITEEHKDTLVVRYDAIEEEDDGSKVIYVVDNSKPSMPETGEAASKDNSILVVDADGEEKSTGFSFDFGAGSVRMDAGEGGMPNGSDSASGKFEPAGGKKIPIEIGIESDYYVEIFSDEIQEGMQVFVNSNNGDGKDAFEKMMNAMGGMGM